MAVTGAIVLAVATAQALLILSSAPMEQLPARADLIAVFPGKPERIAAGVELAAAGRGVHLVVASQVPTAELVRPYLKKTPFPDDAVKMLTAGLSRDTFEDALVTRELVRTHQFKSVILVTSNYHMPRAHALLRLLLLGSGVSIIRWEVAGSNPTDGLQMLSEMAKFWGSLGELTLYKVTGRFLQDILNLS